MNRFALTSFLLALPLAACGGGEQTTQGAIAPSGPVVEYPEWVMKGSGAFGGEKRVLYGVGAVSGVRNLALARRTADNRARSELSQVFDTYSASLMKDYMSSTTAGDMSASDEQQLVESAIKTYSANHLSGVEIVDHWIDQTSGTIYALARMDVESFEGMLDKHKQLSARVKEEVQRASAKAFADLEAEEAKQSMQ